MCGIAVVVGGNENLIDLLNELNRAILNRGPNGISTVQVDTITFTSSILHIQGNLMATQPFIDEDGNILLWNGEVFDGIDLPLEESDTKFVAERLKNVFCLSGSICDFLSLIHGPYAFVYYYKPFSTLYFGRDPFGRRSLLIKKGVRNSFALCSVYPGNNSDDKKHEKCYWEELDVSGIYSVELANINSFKERSSIFLPWPSSRVKLGRPLQSTVEIPQIGFQQSSNRFLEILLNAVKKRVIRVSKKVDPICHQNMSGPDLLPEIPCNIGVLFSGGIDSVLLAAALHLSLDLQEPIELINVAFLDEVSADSTLSVEDKAEEAENNDFKTHKRATFTPPAPAPDRLAAVAALGELQSLYPQRHWRLVHVDVTATERLQHEMHIRSLIHPCDTHMDLNIGSAFWFAARGVGYIRDAYSAGERAAGYSATEHGTALLRLGGDHLPVVTPVPAAALACLNTACRRVPKAGCPRSMCKRCCNDASAGRRSGELWATAAASNCSVHKVKSSPHREPSTCEAESEEGLARTEEETKSPHNPADPREETSPNLAEPLRRPYRCSCRVLLVGIGADEQLAGYGRHRTVFGQGGTAALERELRLDTERLWKRNLGRDDRCVADSGREAWFPFLDESLVSYVQSLSVLDIADLSLPQGQGDKKILRAAAASLGLRTCSQLVKRAIQFGARIAKLTNRQYHGSHRKGKGQTKIGDCSPGLTHPADES